MKFQSDYNEALYIKCSLSTLIKIFTYKGGGKGVRFFLRQDNANNAPRVEIYEKKTCLKN